MSFKDLISANYVVCKYLIHVRKENILRAYGVTLKNDTAFKSMLIETEERFYYLKYDKKPFITAGLETKQFVGEGICINAEIFDNKVRPLMADIIYCNPPIHVYHITYQDFINKMIKHTQKFNKEIVYVYPLAKALERWKVN